MRSAKYRDYWRKVDTLTPAHSAVTSLSYNEKNFSLANLQVISGQNGSGKSSLLKHFSSINYSSPPVFQGVNFVTQISNIGPQDVCRIQYTSPSWLVEENTRRINDLYSAGQFEEYMDGIDAFNFNKEMLECVNYILNTSFTNIHLYEVEQAEGYDTGIGESSFSSTISESSEKGIDDDGIDGTFGGDLLEGKALHIQNSTFDDDIKSTPLSQGEQYIVLLIYLMSIKKGRSILIDEPETYLSPLSQYRLADVLAYFSVENKIQFILATHSICFIEKAKTSNTLMLDGSHGGHLELTTGKRVASFLRRLGYKVPKENIALFEDEGAKRFFSNIVMSFDADWLASMELISLSGESDITEIIERVKSYRLTAIYDADQREKIDPKKYKNHHVKFLPGIYAPEQELILAVKKNRIKFSQKTEIMLGDLNGYMRMIEGIDHHDYFSALAELTARDKWRLFDDAFSIWSSENKEKIAQFIKEFD